MRLSSRVALTLLLCGMSTLASAQANGSCTNSQSINGLPGVVVGPSGPPYFGGDFCNVLTNLTLGAIPNLWANWSGDYGYTGAGKTAINAVGLSVMRATDGNTDPCHPGASYVNNQTGGTEEDTQGYNDTMMTWGRAAGSVHYFMFLYQNTTANPSVCGGASQCGVLLISSSTGCSGSYTPYTVPSTYVAFSQTTPYIAYDFESSSNCPGSASSADSGPCAIMKYNFTSCAPASAPTVAGISLSAPCSVTPTVVYDFASPTGGPSGGLSCLANTAMEDYNETWNGTFRVSSDDTIFDVSLSLNQYTTGSQGTGTIHAVYTVGASKGCRIWNSGAASVPQSVGGGVKTRTLTSVNNSGLYQCSSGCSKSDIGTLFNITGFTNANNNLVMAEAIAATSTSLTFSATTTTETTTGTASTGAFISVNSLPLGPKGAAGTVNTSNSSIGGCSSNCAQQQTGATFPTTLVADSTCTANTADGIQIGQPGAVYAIKTRVSSTLLQLCSAPGTQTGSIYITGIPASWAVGEFGPQGQINMYGCNGTTAICTNGPDAFTTHDSLGGPPGITTVSTPYSNVSDTYCLYGTVLTGGGLCTPGTTNTDGPYDWYNQGLSVYSISGILGHFGKGMYSLVNGNGQAQAAFFPIVSANGTITVGYNISQELNLLSSSNVLQANSPSLDEHASWVPGLYDTNPVMFSNTTHNNSYNVQLPYNSNGSCNPSTMTCTQNVANNGCGGPGSGSPYPFWTSTSLPNCGSGQNPAEGGAFTGPGVNEVLLGQVSQNPGALYYPNSGANTGVCSYAVNGTSGTQTGAAIVDQGVGASGGAPCTNFPFVRVGPNYITAVNPVFDAQNATVDASQTLKQYTLVTDWMGTFGCNPTCSPSGDTPVIGGPNWFKNAQWYINDVITPTTNNAKRNCTFIASSTIGSGQGGGSAPTWDNGTRCLGNTSLGDTVIADCQSAGTNCVNWTLVAQNNSTPGSQNDRFDIVVGLTSPISSQTQAPYAPTTKTFLMY